MFIDVFKTWVPLHGFELAGGFFAFDNWDFFEKWVFHRLSVEISKSFAS